MLIKVQLQDFHIGKQTMNDESTMKLTTTIFIYVVPLNTCLIPKTAISNPSTSLTNVNTRRPNLSTYTLYRDTWTNK